MDKVNIYVMTNVKGVRAADGIYGFVLETETANGPYTLEEFGNLSKVTANRAEAKALLIAIRKLKKPCDLTIYTESAYVASGTKWFSGWQRNGWLTANGATVANRDIWEELMPELGRHTYIFEVKQAHGYKSWLAGEIGKRQQGQKSPGSRKNTK